MSKCTNPIFLIDFITEAVSNGVHDIFAIIFIRTRVPKEVLKTLKSKNGSTG